MPFKKAAGELGQYERSQQAKELFCREYVVDRNGKRAAIAAGYSARTAAQKASTMLNEPAVQERIRQLTKRQLDKADITAERVMLELARLAFADIRKLYDDQGTLIPVDQLDDDTAATIAGLEVEIKTERGAGEASEVITRTAKIRRSDKVAALGVLARHFKIVGNEMDETLSKHADIASRMERAAERMRKLGRG